MKNKLLLLLIGVFFLLTLPGCPTEPVNDGKTNIPDTTSHNFTWQKFKFGGEAGSCNLNDVAIIDENNIWVVGEIYLKDSTGQPDPNAYNAAYWDGNNWELKRIQFYTVCGQSSRSSYPAKSVLAFSDSIIWIAMDGDQITKLEKGVQTETICSPWSFVINKIWGESSNDLYIVGDGGNIVHYQNGQWNKIESGTNLDIHDIWGMTNKNGKVILLCAAYNFGSGGEKKLIRIQDSNIDEIPWVNRELFTVWFNTTDKIYAGGEGLFIRENDEWKEENLPAHFKFRVRGNGLNDIFTVGGYGFCAHYNGKDWKTFEEVSLNGNYYGLAIKGNIVAAVGDEGATAIITIGRRQ